MSIRDLAERETEIGSAITIWLDEGDMVFIQYNSVTLHMPLSDFMSFGSTIDEALNKFGGKV